MRTLLAAVLLAGSPGPAFTVADPRIDEASGMVDLGPVGTAVANDSGDEGRVFLLDRFGRTVGITRYGAATDVEALAPAGRSAVWVGDIGDNLAQRSSVTVRRVPVAAGERTVGAPAYRLVYPDGPHDAETLLRDPRTGRLLVVTKAVGGGAAYAAPRRLSATGDNRLQKVADVPVWATDGAFLDADRVLVRGYATATAFAYPSWRPLATVTLPSEPQGECLSVGPRGRVRILSEGTGQPVLRVSLPPALRGAGGPSASPAEASDTPSASADDGSVDRPSGNAAPSTRTGEVAVTVGLAALIVLALVGLGALVVRRRG